MIEIFDLKINNNYVDNHGNKYVLFKPFGYNDQCFVNVKDGVLSRGRDFVVYLYGDRVLSLSWQEVEDGI